MSKLIEIINGATLPNFNLLIAALALGSVGNSHPGSRTQVIAVLLEL